jgi:hypothetical protein
MDVAASVDRLISSLQTLKSAIPSLESGEMASEFDALFAEASAKLNRIVSGSTFTTALNEAGIMPPAEPEAIGFAQFSTKNWLVDRQSDAISARPNMKQFMDATGVSASDASELLYGVIGSNADLRDWSKIMASGNPVDAARAATGQLYNSDKDYALVNHADFGTLRFNDTLAESSLVSKTVLSQSGNFADIETDAAANALMAVSSTGLLLRGAGANQEQIQRTAWLFGFDVPEIYA